jgi:prophage DNA circulation protein
MTLFNQLFPATYNGVPFLIDSSDMKYGRKTQTFEYPNKKYRFVEDLGENLRTFDVVAVITGNDDYFLRREALIFALQIKGIGLLTHPLYGLVFVTVKTYSVAEELTSLGECKFNITFEESKPNLFPILGEATLDAIEAAINVVGPIMVGAFSSQFSTSHKHNAIDAANKAEKLNLLLQPTKPVAVENNVLNDFNAKSLLFSANKYGMVQDGETYANSISDLLDAYNNLGQTTAASYDLLASVYYFGRDDIPVKQNTAERIQRVANRKIVNSYVNTLLLMSLYKNAMQLEYLDDQQVSSRENDLEKKYQYLMNNNVLEIDILLQLKNIRNIVKRFFNQLKVNTSKVITVNVPKTPLTVLLYRYYANFDNEDEIISLNNLNNVTKISGDIKILSEVAQ